MTYTEPLLPLLLLLGLAGVARAWISPSARRRPWLQTVALIGICVVSTEAGAWLLSRPLERGYSPDPFPHENADAIVVLAGTVIPASAARPYALPAQDTYRRVEHAVWLFRYWRALPILVSGGGSPPYAYVMQRVLETEGIPRNMIWTEPRSENTHENAVYGARVLREHGVSRIVLVVEAAGMPRAVRAFQKAGISVVAAPIRPNHLTRELTDFVPGWRGIELSSETLHEFVGLAWYKLRGWI